MPFFGSAIQIRSGPGPVLSWLEELYRKSAPVRGEILVRGKNGNIQPLGHGAYEEISVRTLNAPFSASTVHFSSLFINRVLNRDIFKKGELFLQSPESAGSL